MKKAADFRADARAALNGGWAEAVGTSLVATLLGGSVLMNNTSAITGSFRGNSESYQQMTEQIPVEALKYVLAVVFTVASVTAIFTIVRFVVGGFVSLGLIQYNMNLIDGVLQTTPRRLKFSWMSPPEGVKFWL